MKIKLKRILTFISLALLVFLGGIATLILFPQPLFSNSYHYDNFTIYSNYEVQQKAMNRAIDQANAIIQTSELYDADYTYDLFLAHNTFFNKLDDVVLDEWAVARAIDNNLTVKRQLDEQAGTVQNGENQFDLVYVLVHEMTHCLQSHKYGKWAFNPFHHPPYWKLEGYPEYMGRRKLLDSPDYDLRKGIKDFLKRTANNPDMHQIIQTSANTSTPYIYYKGRLLIEYLIDIKGMSYDDILDNAVTEEAIFEEMLEWYGE